MHLLFFHISPPNANSLVHYIRVAFYICERILQTNVAFCEWPWKHKTTKQLNTTKLLLWSHREKLKSSVILQYLEARLFPRKSRPWDPQSCIFRRPCQDLTHNPLASWIFINLPVIYSLQSMMVTHVHWRYCRLNEVHSKVKMGRVYLHHPDVNTQNSLIRLCILRSN